MQLTLFALDCGATNWRLYRAGYQRAGNVLRILGDPQPSPLTSFSDRNLPAALTLTPDGTSVESIGEIAQMQLEDETARARVREYFKPCIGAHLEPNPLPHQQRYTHAQALDYTRLMLETVLEQIRREKWRSSSFDERLRFAFAYPVHWRDEHNGALFAEFRALVRSCFSEAMHAHLRFVAEPEGAILSLNHQGLLNPISTTGNITLIVDVGGSSSDVVAGRLDPHSGELLILGRYGQPFGGGLYDAALAAYLADEMGIPAAALVDDPTALTTLRVFGKRLKEALSRGLLQNPDGGSNVQRTLTLVLHSGEIYRRLIKLDRDIFERVAGELNRNFEYLITEALNTMSLTEGEIGQVMLVGGGAQLYSVVRYLRARFGDEKVVLADNPDEMVVRGIALEYGAQMGMIQPGASLMIEPPSRLVSAPEADSTPEPEWRLIDPEGQVYVLEAGATTKVGRARAAHIWLDSEKVSRAHAEIHLSGDTLSVTDLGSTNGTFVNGERIRAKLPCRLNSGDEIRFGDRFFRVQIFVVRDVNWEN